MNEVVGSPESVGFSSQRLQRIRPVMQSYVDARGFGGICTLLARRGQIVHFEQVGWQDREAGIPLGADTIYRIYSMTKPVVCTALMTLFEEGRFQLYEPVAKYIPAFARMRVLSQDTAGELQESEANRPITIRDLFTHTSGLTYAFLEDNPVAELYRQAHTMSGTGPLEQLIAEIARLPLAYQPGSRYHYSVAIDVLGHLIEVLSGQPLQDFLQQRLFTPLGMKDTGFSVPLAQRGRIAAMYGTPDIATHTLPQCFAAWEQGQAGRQEVEATNPSDNTTTFARGGHGLFSTAYDYLRFAQMLLKRGELDGARVLAPKVVDLMHQNHVSPALLPFEVGGGYSPGYGFGLGSRVLLNVADSGMPGSPGEYGWSGAAKTYYWVDPQEQLVGVFMTQYMVGFDLPESDFRTLAYQAMLE